MSAADAAQLASLPSLLPGWAFAFVMVLARLSAALLLLPGLGEASLPPSVRLALALALTLLLLPLLAPLEPAVPGDIAHLMVMVAAEVLIGVWFGLLARLLMLALPAAGEVLSLSVGLSSVLLPDRAAGGASPEAVRLFGLIAPLLILSTRLHALLLSALVGTYHVFPPGVMLPVGDATEMVLRGVLRSFSLAMQLASPFLLVGLVWQVGMALISRLVPNLQIYFVAMPAQILTGLVLLGMLSTAMLTAWGAAMRDGFGNLPGFF